MARNEKIARAVRFAILAGTASAVASTAAVAQQAQDRGATVEEIVVTGSRIMRRDYDAPSPVYTLDASSIRDAGTPQLEQVLNELPQLVPSITTTSNNPSLGGMALVDLRGLDASRTLVLLDGGRLQPSTTGGLVDLNTIPSGLIESVEIVTGGASAVYGSDAIAGVVNVRLRRDFEGVEIRGHSGGTWERDGRQDQINLLIGGNFDNGRGNAVMYFDYDRRDEVMAGERAFSVVALGATLAPTGSVIVPEGFYAPAALNQPTQAAADAVWTQYGAAPGQVPNTSLIGFNQDGTIFSRTDTVNFKGDTSDPGFNPDLYSYNYSPVNYLQLPLTRRQVAAFTNYELTPNVAALASATYTTYSAAQELAATPISSGVGSTMAADNPLIPADLRTILDSRPDPDAGFTFYKRPLEVGPRNATNEYDVVQLRGGLEGDFELAGQRWNWDVIGSWGRTQRMELQTGNVSRSRLESVYNDPTALAGSGCAMFNPFGAGNITPACAEAIAIQAQNITVVTSRGATAAMTGPVFDLPAGPLQVAFGAEYREMEADFRPDEFLASGDVVGFNAQQPVNGSIDVREAFIEVSVPVLSDITGIDYLGLDGAYRYSDYNLAGSVNTYMVGIDYQPINQLKLRGTYNRAIRAPSVFNLFRPQSEGFPQYLDPCWNGSAERTGPNAAQVDALCAAQGTGPNFPEGNRQVRALSGGNPNLQPEEADTYTIGAVWTPDFGDTTFRMAVDWFRYELDDVIGSVGAASIVSRCFNDQGANPTYSPNNLWCQMFSRSPAGVAENVQQFDQNLGKRNIDGVDVQAEFGMPAGPGTLTASLALTRLLKWEQQEDPASPLTSQAGTIGVILGETFPKWKARLSTGYRWDAFDFRWTMRYIDGMDVVNSGASRARATSGVRPSVSSYTYHRLTAGWAPLDNVSLTLGVDNVFDKNPPIYTADSGAGVQANTDPSTYDVLGRRWFLNGMYRF